MTAALDNPIFQDADKAREHLERALAEWSALPSLWQR